MNIPLSTNPVKPCARRWRNDMKPTNELRFVLRTEVIGEPDKDGTTVGRYVRILQQKWEPVLESDIAEWRDVPLVKEK